MPPFLKLAYSSIPVVPSYQVIKDSSAVYILVGCHVPYITILFIIFSVFFFCHYNNHVCADMFCNIFLCLFLVYCLYCGTLNVYCVTQGNKDFIFHNDCWILSKLVPNVLLI